MLNIEALIEFLSAKGVKSLHIEMQDRSAVPSIVAEPSARVEKPADRAPQAAKHDIPVHRGEAEIAPPPPPPPPREEKKPAPVVEEKKAEPPVSEKKIEEKKIMEKKAEPPAKPAPKETSVDKILKDKVYEVFCEKISADDGTFSEDERKALIGRMGLDDLLRVNNDFTLGLDTDVPVETLRAKITECF